MQQKSDIEIREEFNDNLVQIEKRLQRFNSMGYVFMRGIIQGVGSFIGATIVAGILIALLGSIIRSVEDVPILNRIIEETQLTDTLNE